MALTPLQMQQKIEIYLALRNKAAQCLLFQGGCRRNIQYSADQPDGYGNTNLIEKSGCIERTVPDNFFHNEESLSMIRMQITRIGKIDDFRLFIMKNGGELQQN